MVGYHRVDQKRTEVFRKKHVNRLHRAIITTTLALRLGRAEEITEMLKIYKKVIFLIYIILPV